mmetsp:Transcript_3359/g.7940  ORF Transcript_3359/g.7940 Transcript_3359/m.7940 type:complete len:271 (-) Transcript_3359:555-1367(-)
MGATAGASGLKAVASATATAAAGAASTVSLALSSCSAGSSGSPAAANSGAVSLPSRGTTTTGGLSGFSSLKSPLTPPSSQRSMAAMDTLARSFVAAGRTSPGSSWKGSYSSYSLSSSTSSTCGHSFGDPVRSTPGATGGAFAWGGAAVAEKAGAVAATACCPTTVSAGATLVAPGPKGALAAASIRQGGCSWVGTPEAAGAGGCNACPGGGGGRGGRSPRPVRLCVCSTPGAACAGERCSVPSQWSGFTLYLVQTLWYRYSSCPRYFCSR